jgi:DNA (cytosine-5)-methyltransferase 1
MIAHPKKKPRAVKEEQAPYGNNGGANLASPPLTCIDLFAGCGGLSLGLELAGFHPLLFSELNISAAETYMLNRLGQHIIPVGDVYSLTNANLALLKVYWKQQGIEDVDLVCGGPPCQGYSGIGHRRTFKLDKEEIPSNHLYEEMVRVIRAVNPKVFIFENVRGLLSAKWDKSGTNGEIFRDVLKAFRTLAGYHIRWELVHAKDYGVPQNRPRVLMVGKPRPTASTPCPTNQTDPLPIREICGQTFSAWVSSAAYEIPSPCAARPAD